MVVYVDLAFVINLFVDASLLFVTATVLRARCRSWRVFTAAAVGSAYAVATLFPGTGTLRLFVVKWLCSVVMVQIALGPSPALFRHYREWARLLRQVAVFYAVAFAAGGAVYGLQNLFHARPELSGLALVHGRIAWWTSIGALAIVSFVPVGLWLVRLALVAGRRLRANDRHLCDVEIRLGGRAVQLRALVDTGNSLADPISRAPVAIVRAGAVADLLPPALYSPVLGGADPLRALYGSAQELGEFSERVRIVPFRGVGGRDGQLLAFRPDDAIVRIKGTESSVMPLLVAMQAQPLARTEHYDCLLPAVIDLSNFVERRDPGVDSDAHAAGLSSARSSHTA